MTNPNTECAYCKTPLYKKPSLITKSKSGLFFCSREHQGMGLRKNSGLVISSGPKPIAKPDKQRYTEYDVNHTCVECETDFISRKLKDNFCSYNCLVTNHRACLDKIGMKNCPKCGESKGLEMFSKSSTTKDRLQYSCKECSSKKYAKWVEKNNLDHRFYSFSKKRKQENREKLKSYLEDKYCIDCGLDDFRLLVFDHVRGEKFGGVSTLVTRGVRWEAVIEEIDKCEIRCHHCHILITAERGNYWWTKV